MEAKRLRTLGGLLFVAAIAMSVVTAVPALAGENEGVCVGLDSGKIDVSDPPSVTITAPEGFLIDEYCVKAGSIHNGFGPVYVPVDPPQEEVTITYPGKDSISHYSYSLVPVAPETYELCMPDGEGGYVLEDGLSEEEFNDGLENGGVVPDEGTCPEGEEETPPPPGDEVLPDRLDKPADDVKDERLDRPAVAGETLPFTGVDPNPFLALASLMAASGATAMVISRSRRR